LIRAIRRHLAALGNPSRGLFFVLLGFAVRIHPTFWLTAFLLGMGRAALVATLVGWLLVVLVSILAHELGHAVVAARWGVVYRITLHGAGGETTWRPLARIGAWQHVAVSLAGPVAGFGLALAGWLLQGMLSSSGPWLLALAANDLVRVNVAWGLFNLLPIAPLDGGQALRTWLGDRWGERGEWAAAGIGLVAALAGLVAALLAGQTWAALVLGIYGIHNGQAFRDHCTAYRDAHTHTRWHRPLARDQVRERH